MNRAELELYTADVEATEKLANAKDAYRDKPTPANKEKLAAAKREIYELRVYWRDIRQLVVGGNIPTVSTKARSN